MRKDAGSIFIETLVAVLIVAMVMGMAYRALADAASRGRTAELRRGALLVAQSQLTAATSGERVAFGDLTGVSPPYVWRVTVEPHGAALADSASGVLAAVTVTVRAERGGPALASLHTLRLAGPR